jgi:hypothetical protein
MVQSMSAIYLQCFCAFVMFAGKNSLEISHLIYRLPFFPTPALLYGWNPSGLWNLLHVEGLYCKRPIQCVASSEILTLTARQVCTGGGTHSLDGEGVVGQWFGRRQTLYSVLYKCKYFVNLQLLAGGGKVRALGLAAVSGSHLCTCNVTNIR